jgi:hypothetical protein
MYMRNSAARRILTAVMLSLALSAPVLADDVDGTWRLVKRQLPDGTVLTPPAVVGLHTITQGLRHLNVFWHTPDGRPASIGVVSKVNLTDSQFAETLLAFALDDGSGNPVVYNFSQETRTVAVTRAGIRVSYKMPFDPPSVVYEGDRATATLEGAFVDYWERVR